MRIDEAGKRLIKEFEGLDLNAYQDDGGVWTIGWGHTKGVMAGQTITLNEAENFLIADVTPVENTLNGLIPKNCTQDQFNALVDFGFNLGRGALKTMLDHGWNQIPQQILRWDKGRNENGELLPVPGLTRRRKAEADLFAGGSDAEQ